MSAKEIAAFLGGTVVLKIPAEPVIALAERYPAFIKEMALMIGRRLRAAHDSMTSLAAEPVEACLAATLLRLATREGLEAVRESHCRFTSRGRA